MVIQRLQNLYLLIAGILMAAFAFVPAINVEAGEVAYNINAIGVNTSSATNLSPGHIALTLLTILFIAITICKFKKLKIQKSLSGICMLLNIALVVAMAITAYLTANADLSSITVRAGMALPLLSLALETMARIGIKKDIKLLSDSSRLR